MGACGMQSGMRVAPMAGANAARAASLQALRLNSCQKRLHWQETYSTAVPAAPTSFGSALGGAAAARLHKGAVALELDVAAGVQSDLCKKAHVHFAFTNKHAPTQRPTRPPAHRASYPHATAPDIRLVAPCLRVCAAGVSRTRSRLIGCCSAGSAGRPSACPPCCRRRSRTPCCLSPAARKPASAPASRVCGRDVSRELGLMRRETV